MRDTLLADRIRAAACVALKECGEPLPIVDLVEHIRSRGVPIPAPANKTLSDLLRTSVQRGHLARCGWGIYRLDRLPRTTEQAMRRRLATYAAGIARQPHSHRDLSHEEAAALQQARSVAHV